MENIVHRNLYIIFDENGKKQSAMEIEENSPMAFVQKTSIIEEKEVFVNNVLFSLESKQDKLMFFVNANYILENMGISQDKIFSGKVKKIESIDLSEYGFDIKNKGV